MILNNYWKAIKSLERITGWSGTFNSGMIKTDGSALGNLLTYVGGTASSGLWQIRTKGMSAVIGSGTGEVTAADYCLFDDVTASISNFSVTSNMSPTDYGLSEIFTLGGDNNSGAEITITEVGITKTYSGNNELAEGGSGTVMFAKILLDNPITVANGASFQLTVQWLES